MQRFASHYISRRKWLQYRNHKRLAGKFNLRTLEAIISVQVRCAPFLLLSIMLQHAALCSV